MQAAADRASDILKAMSNRHRLLMLCQLVERERSVGELADLLGIRDSGVSQHLALLRAEGLVTARREGQTIWYSVASTEARALLATLYEVFCAPAGPCDPKTGRKDGAQKRRRIERNQ